MGSKETAKARNSTRSASGDSPVQAQALLSLQSTAGNRAVASSLPVQRAKGKVRAERNRAAGIASCNASTNRAHVWSPIAT